MARKKGGKYAEVCKGLPSLPGVEPERKDVVEAVKTAIRTAQPTEFAGDEFDRYVSHDRELREALDVIDGQFKRIIAIQKSACAGRPWASEFGKGWADMRMIDNRLKGWQSSINLLTEAYLWLMVEQLEVEGMTSVELVDGRKTSTHLEPYAQIVDPEAFRLWCLERGHERAMVLPWGTVNSMVKDMLIAGEEPPPSLKVWAKTAVKLLNAGAVE